MAVSQEQYNDLFRHCVGFAAQMLQKFGEFYPFGMSIGADGQIAPSEAYTGAEQPDVQAIIVSLANTFAEGVRKGEIQAVAVVANVDMPEQLNAPSPDGVRVLLESQDLSRIVYVPYQLETNDQGGVDKVIFSDAFAADIPHQFFAAQA